MYIYIYIYIYIFEMNSNTQDPLLISGSFHLKGDSNVKKIGLTSETRYHRA